MAILAAFKANVPLGHMIVNRSDADVVFLEIGTRARDEISTYSDPDIDMVFEKKDGAWRALHRDGRVY